MEYFLDFASELRRLRRSRGFSQAALARRAQVSERAVRYWEAGTTFPGAWELQSVLTVLAPEPNERIQLVSLLPNRRGALITRRESTKTNDVPGAPPALGDLLRAMRFRRGLTQSQVADQMRVTRSTVLRWESTRSLPSEGNLERLCVLYAAHAEECRILQSRLMQPLGEPSLPAPSLNGYDEKVARLAEAINWPNSPLIDLRALLLKHELWSLAANSENALHLLVMVQVRHGLYLIQQDRKKEAVACLNHGLMLFQGKQGTHRIWRELINVAAPFVGKGPTKDEGALRLVQKWLPSFPDTVQTTLWCDMALYAARAGQHGYAAHCLKQAQKILPQSAEAAYLSEHYFPVTQAKTLLCAKRPWEALNWLARLPDPHNSVGSQALHELYWIEALLTAGEKARAQTRMDTLSALLVQFPQPFHQNRLNQLAAFV